MDKTILLIRKYGFSNEYAEFVKKKILYYEVGVNHGKYVIQKDNKKTIELIKKSSRSSIPLDLNNVRTVNTKNQISLIDFTINDKRYSIDDPWVISSIQHFISQTGFVFTEKMKRGQQTKPTYLKELAIELMEKAPEGTDYKKHVWVGEVFSEFLQEYKECASSHEHLHKKVLNLLNG
jgi:hypothetical protein